MRHTTESAESVVQTSTKLYVSCLSTTRVIEALDSSLGARWYIISAGHGSSTLLMRRLDGMAVVIKKMKRGEVERHVRGWQGEKQRETGKAIEP